MISLGSQTAFQDALENCVPESSIHPKHSSMNLIRAEHSYACDPAILKRKYHEMFQQLDQTKKGTVEDQTEREKDKVLFRIRLATAEKTAENLRGAPANA